MHVPTKPLLALVVGMSVMGSTQARAEDQIAPAAFFGIDQVALLIEDPPKGMPIDRSELRDLLELRLRAAGVPLASLKADPLTPYVYLRVRGGKVEGEALWIYDVCLDFCQMMATKFRSPWGGRSEVADVVSPFDCQLGYAASGLVHGVIRRTVERLADGFALNFIHAKEFERRERTKANNGDGRELQEPPQSTSTTPGSVPRGNAVRAPKVDTDHR